jgi:hypothetical protein
VPQRLASLASLLTLLLFGCAGGEGSPGSPPPAPRTASVGAGFEAPPQLHARDVLRPDQLRGRDHEVADAVRNDGFINYYTVQVREPEATLEVAGTELLEVRRAELDAVAEMQEVKKGQTFVQATKDAATGPLRFARNLVTSPGETFSSTAAGIGSRVSNIGHALFGTTGAGEENALETAIGFANTKRAYAYRFGVDPYSTNEVLQAELDGVAWTGFAGGAAVGAGFSALPDTAGTVAGAGGLGERMNKALRDNAPAELMALNVTKLRAMGVPGEVAQALLDNENYTPTERTRFVAALERLDGVADRGALVEWAAAAPRPEVAFLMARHAELLAAYHVQVRSLARFVRLEGRALPLDRDGEIVAVFPVDYVVWSERLEAAVRGVGRPGGTPVSGRQFWITGRFSPLARSELEAAGWTLHEQAGDRLRLD